MKAKRRAPMLAPLIAAGALAACGGGADGDPPAAAGADAAPAAAAAGGAEAVKTAIREHIRERGDSVTLEHPVTGEPVRLVFDHIHEAVEETPGGRRTACVDFTGLDGTVYDVDFYVDGLRVEDVVMHEKAGASVIPDSLRARLEAEGAG